jgi:hypothetical protein
MSERMVGLLGIAWFADDGSSIPAWSATMYAAYESGDSLPQPSKFLFADKREQPYLN